ncbi:hypothetical protein BDR26DRAFT_863512 [Obelidium mucronatum]|nr:hypothetical protein BDR26DRAFT_863512 [Obelidium mucronatum]
MSIFRSIFSKPISRSFTTRMTSQLYRYLAVLDFEATCDENVRLRPQEIIEFPTCVIDTSLPNFPIVNTFHTYVRPVHHPVLTRFCTELTGIQQETVNAAPTFPEVWTQFLEFLASNSLTESNTLFVTCGHWDLMTMLPTQTKASRIKDVPAVLKQWCNLKVAVKNHTGKDIRGMPDMLNHFNLPLIGRHHSGIDDSRNIAAVAQALLQQNYVFAVTPKNTQAAPPRNKPAAPAPAAAAAAAVVESVAVSSTSTAPAAAPEPAPKKKNQPRAPPPPPPACGPLIDIGANLSHHPFTDETLPEYLRRAKEANVVHIMITGTSLKSSKEAIRICRKYNGSNMYPHLTCTVGVHPHDATRSLEHDSKDSNGDSLLMKELEGLIVGNKDIVVAVGECGLDFDRNFSTPADQEEMFLMQCRLSVKLGMPLFLHERSAHYKFLEVVLKVNAEYQLDEKKLFGVVHCYTGETEEHLYACLGAGFHIGITGWVTDERPGRGSGLAKICSKIPLDRLMIETDAPFLLPRNIKPAPKVCEPALVGHVAVKLAELYEMSVQKIAEASTKNAAELFKLKV